MRTQLVSIVLVVIAVQGCLAARDLRQTTMQCPKELSKPVMDYMQSLKYIAGVGKACVKRANPNCYPECTCAAYSTVGAVLAYEGARNHPELLKQYRQACVRAISNKVTASVLPVHVRKEHSRATCLLKIADWAKAESVLEKCPAMVDLMKEKGVRTQG